MRRPLAMLVVLGAVLVTEASGMAQEAADGGAETQAVDGGPEEPPAPAATESAPPVQQRVEQPSRTAIPPTTLGPPTESGPTSDANIDHAFVTPTALTMPGGTAAFSDWYIFILGVSLGITNNVQVSVVLLPFGAAAGSLKVRVPIGERVHLAGIGAAATGGDLTVQVASVVASVCLDVACSSVLSSSISKVFGDVSRHARPLLAGSLIVAASRSIKVIAEAVEATYAPPDDDDNVTAAFALGLRFTSSAPRSRAATDVGLMEFWDTTNRFWSYPLPFIGFTIRTR